MIAILALVSGHACLVDADRGTGARSVRRPAEEIPAAEPAAEPQPRVALDPVGDPEPATRAAARVLDVLDDIEASVQTTRYQHTTKVRERQGLYAWDCSGMAAWVLGRAAPRALEAIGRGRPVARDFYRAIERAPVGKARKGWQRLAGVAEARPGDVFAWLRPPHLPKTITGHVGFVVDSPRPVSGIEGAYLVRISDATRLPHGEDSRAPDGEGGFGEGELLFITDEQGVATHYGWFGLESQGFLETQVLFGRVSR